MKQIRLLNRILVIENCHRCPINSSNEIDESCGLCAGDSCLQHLETDFPEDCPLEDAPEQPLSKKEHVKAGTTEGNTPCYEDTIQTLKSWGFKPPIMIRIPDNVRIVDGVAYLDEFVIGIITPLCPDGFVRVK